MEPPLGYPKGHKEKISWKVIIFEVTRKGIDGHGLLDYGNSSLAIYNYCGYADFVVHHSFLPRDQSFLHQKLITEEIRKQ